MKIKSSVLFLLSSVFLASCAVRAAEDPLAGEPEGERIALWPEGKIPGVVQMGICRNTDWVENGKGALVMSFDDRNFAVWENAAPLFRKYDARVTFFFCGVLDDQAKKSLRWLSHHNGHSIGLHGLGHRNADSAVASMGAVEYWTKEIAPQRRAEYNVVRLSELPIHRRDR